MDQNKKDQQREQGTSNELVSDRDAREDLPHAPAIKVLFADLHRVIADTCAMILNLSGFLAFPAHSVDEAVRIASEKAIDVAFIELLIGETDAIDAAERILAVRPYCRIILWTGRREPVLSWVRREADRRFGGCELILKPVHPQDLIRILRGETVLHESRDWVADEDCLGGAELHQYLREARECMLTIYKEQDALRAYAAMLNTFDVSKLEPLLADDFHYSSELALVEIRTKQGFLKYIRGKLNTLQSSGIRIWAAMGWLNQTWPGPCVVISEGGKNDLQCIVLAKVEDGKIKRLDQRVVPLPESAERTGEYPK
jgi:DNA-binding response OmpR family regulator